MAYVKDLDRTRTGFTTYESAKAAAEQIRKELNDPKELKHRIRTRLRSRTGMWDVVVKTKREEKAS